MTSSAGGRVRLSLLGGFGLRAGAVSVPVAPAGQRLLALLGLHESALRRGYLAGLLWADVTEQRALGSLRSTLWKLRLSGVQLVDLIGEDLQLAPDVEVDVREATDLAHSLMAGDFPDHAMSLVEPRLCCDLLPGWYEDWVLVERERHRQVSLHALESLSERLTAGERFGAAVLAALAAVDRDPLRESAHRTLIKAHLAEGNAGEALRRYRHYAELARRELGLEPSPLMTGLVAHVAVPRPRTVVVPRPAVALLR